MELDRRAWPPIRAADRRKIIVIILPANDFPSIFRVSSYDIIHFSRVCVFMRRVWYVFKVRIIMKLVMVIYELFI